MQLPPQSNCHRLSSCNIFAALFPPFNQAALVSFFWEHSKILPVQRSEAKVNIRSILPSILPRCTWVSIQRSPTTPLFCCSTHIKYRARVMPSLSLWRGQEPLFLTLNLHAWRQPIWAQVRQVKPTLKCNKNNYGVSLTTTKHAEIIHQSTPQIRITSQYLPIAQMTITSVRNKFTRPTSPGATRATTSQRVPSKYPADPTFRWEICSIPPPISNNVPHNSGTTF